MLSIPPQISKRLKIVYFAQAEGVFEKFSQFLSFPFFPIHTRKTYSDIFNSGQTELSRTEQSFKKIQKHFKQRKGEKNSQTIFCFLITFFIHPSPHRIFGMKILVPQQLCVYPPCVCENCINFQVFHFSINSKSKLFFSWWKIPCTIFIHFCACI